MSDSNYSYISGIVTGVLATTGVASILGAIILLLLRGWATYVNNCLKEIFDRFKAENAAKDERWARQRAVCDAHTAGLAELKGKMEERKK